MAQQAKLTLLIELADKLSDKLGKIENKLANFQDRVQKRLNNLSEKISKKLGMSTTSLKKGLMVGATAGIAALGTLAVKGVNAAAKFDEAFMPIRQLNLDKSKGTLDEYRNKIRDASYEVGTNLTDSTNAIYDLQSATGIFGDDAISIFKKVGKYSVATGANINDAMNSTTKAMKAFGLGVDDIDKLLESNAKTVQTGITTFDELARVQTVFGGAAKSAGQDVDAANKMFAMFTSIGTSDAESATLTKSFFQGLRQNADKIEKTLGIKVFDDKGSMRQADTIMKDLADKFKGMSDREVGKLINEIGGPDGLQNALGKAAKGADDMIATFDAFDSSKFNLDEALKNAQGDFTKMKELFSNRLEVVLSKIGDAIIPYLLQLFEILNPALDWLNENMDWLIPAFISFAGVLGIVTAAMWLLNSSMFANPIGLIIAGVAALITIIAILVNKIEGWGNLWDYTVKFVKAVWNGFLTNLELTWLNTQDLLLSGIEKIMIAWYSLKSLWNEAEAQEGLAKIEKQSAERAAKINKTKELSEYYKLEAVNNLTGALNSLSWKKDKEEEKKDTPSLYGGTNGVTDTSNGGGGLGLGTTGKGNPKVSDNVNKVTGASTQAKNITINIEALHKGNNNLSGNDGQRLNMQQYEEMFNEMMMRIIRNAELS